MKKINYKKLLRICLVLPLSITSISICSFTLSCSQNSIDSSSNKPDNSGGSSTNIPPGWSIKSDTTPEQVNQYPISHLKEYHFNFPNYDNNLVTLKAEGEPTHNYPGDENTPTGEKQFAKEGVIPTQKHLELAKRVFSVTFDNTTDFIGTCWILDYKLTSDGSYPRTFYFGTNAHVLDDLRVANDTNYPEKFGSWDPNKYNDITKTMGKYRGLNTRAISLYKINVDNVQLGKKIDNSPLGQSNDIWDVTTINMFDNSKSTDYVGEYNKGYYINKPPAKTIFLGNDFLKTSPSQYSTNSFSDREEYADFGVFELTFESSEQAQRVTNNYANWPKDQQFKYRETDLVSHPNHQTDKVYDFGFPQIGLETPAIRNIATNTNQVLYDKGTSDKNQGLSESKNYNTWTNKPGGKFDGFIAMPWFGYEYETYDNNKSNQSNYVVKTKYATHGLIYAINNGNLAPGSSGGLTVDEDGYAIGVHFGSDNNAATGQSQAFYCEGYNYKGYYGDWNLPQYDLIRGGYPLQKNSYYDGLVKIYGKDPNFKTALFPNGLGYRR